MWEHLLSVWSLHHGALCSFWLNSKCHVWHWFLSVRCRPESSTQSKDSTVGSPSNFKESSLHGQVAFRPLPSPSRSSCQSTPATGKTISRTSCTTDTKETQDLVSHKGYLSEIPYKCNGNGNEFYLENSFLTSTFQSSKNLEKRDLELHLYIISTASSIFLHLKSSWNNYNIVSILTVLITGKHAFPDQPPHFGNLVLEFNNNVKDKIHWAVKGLILFRLFQ